MVSSDMHTIDAELQDGVLRPKEPLRLHPGERVRIIVMRQSDPLDGTWSAWGAPVPRTMSLPKPGSAPGQTRLLRGPAVSRRKRTGLTALGEGDLA